MFNPFLGGLNGDDFFDDGSNDGWPSYESSEIELDPLYYHTRCKGMVIVRETETSALLRTHLKFEFWMPKKLIKRDANGTIYIHTDIGVRKIYAEAKEKFMKRYSEYAD